MIPAPLRAPPTGTTPKVFGATESGGAFLFLRNYGSERASVARAAKPDRVCRLRFNACSQPARLPLEKNKMLLLFPEQEETAATINQCVVFRINFGPHARDIFLLAIAKDPHGPRPVVQAVQPEKVSVLRIAEQPG